ncbi:hypothetical protein LJK88_14865 [Paenibacillus sp. P26]|nr:hypothetical protein LJK88_14865 [Paenibacillus sp. P26]UUZ96842.1 hypothetical protein LJK87_22890 [Paenibacillus sp. P25]
MLPDGCKGRSLQAGVPPPENAATIQLREAVSLYYQIVGSNGRCIILFYDKSCYHSVTRIYKFIGMQEGTIYFPVGLLALYVRSCVLSNHMREGEADADSKFGADRIQNN